MRNISKTVGDTYRVTIND